MSDESKNDPSEGRDPKNREETMAIDIVPKRKRWLINGAIILLIAAVIVLGFCVAYFKAELDTANLATQKVSQDLDTSRKNLQSLNTARQTEQAASKEAGLKCEEQIAGLESALESTKTAIGELRDEKREATKELAQFKAFSTRFKRMIDAGKLEVVFRRGRMVVNLPAQVLFDSGSADLSADGTKALTEVAKILRTVRDKRFVVAGHTDDEQIKKSKFASNWELSTARALTVAETLIKAGLKPWNLVAAGYSQYAPIASNKGDEGRQKNRRIEIILEPYLKDIEPPKAPKPAAAKPKAAASSKAKKK